MLNINIATKLGIANKYDWCFRPFLTMLSKLKIIVRNKPKVFVIGFNKTGTTTLFHALKEFDYVMSNQHDFERLHKKILNKQGNTETILKKCEEYEVFQDIPFSLPGFYKLVDSRFKKSKFILTVRSDSEVWYNSFNKYYRGVDGLKNSPYNGKGYLYRTFSDSFGTNSFLKEECIKVYNNHIKEVKTYFKDRPDQLLVLDVANKSSYINLCEFLGQEPTRDSFEWKNKTR